jgi:hypothetical protein
MLMAFVFLTGLVTLWLTPAGTAVANTMRPLLVQIVNDSSAPVPVTGTTTIGGTADVNVVSLPAVQAQQSGAWNVGINGTPTVNAHLMSGAFVGIDPANNTVQIASSAGTPFQKALLQLNTLPVAFSVPPDKRLVIEFVSGECGSPDASSVLLRASLSTTVGGELAAHFMPIEPRTTAPALLHTFAFQARIHADPGSSVSFSRVAAEAPPGLFQCHVTVSGQLVDP